MVKLKSDMQKNSISLTEIIVGKNSNREIETTYKVVKNKDGKWVLYKIEKILDWISYKATTKEIGKFKTKQEALNWAKRLVEEATSSNTEGR